MKHVLSRGRQAVIGNTKKFFDLREKEIKTARQCPTSYHPQHTTVLHKSPNYSIPRSRKTSKFDRGGVGTKGAELEAGSGADNFYDKDRPFGHDTRYGYLSRSKEKFFVHKEVVPGAGTYDPNLSSVQARSYQAKIPIADKVDTFDSTSATDCKVGPGSYEVVDSKLGVTHNKVYGGAFGTDEKLKMGKLTSPAPNHYLINDMSVRPNKLSYSIGRASVQDRGQLVPHGDLGFTTLGRNSTAAKVGPGSYSHNDDILHTKFPINSIPKASRELH